MNKFNTFEVNDDHILIFPQFHDGMLKKIEILNENNLLILIETKKKEIYKIIFNGVEYLKVNNFTIGNIILDMEIWKGCLCSIDFLKKNLYLNEDQNVQYLTKIVNEIKLGVFMLIIINPSYGAELICICKSIDQVESSIKEQSI